MKNKKLILLGATTLAIATAAILYMKKKEELDYDENPPKRAPQLDIENPGSQHNFPKPPMESDMG
jgi:hypothetical protein